MFDIRFFFSSLPGFESSSVGRIVDLGSKQGWNKIVLVNSLCDWYIGWKRCFWYVSFIVRWQISNANSYYFGIFRVLYIKKYHRNYKDKYITIVGSFRCLSLSTYLRRIFWPKETKGTYTEIGDPITGVLRE